MKVQRIRQTQITLLGSGLWLQVAKAHLDRVYLGFWAMTNTTPLFASTTASAAVSSGILLYNAAGAFMNQEMYAAVHGELVRTEWYWRNTTVGANVAGTVIELIEEETGVQKSDGGIILAEQKAMVSAAETLQSDRAAFLRRAVESSLGAWSERDRRNNGRNVYASI